MAVVPVRQANVLEAVREKLGGIPWVQAVWMMPDPAGLQIWTIPSPPDASAEEAVYAQELEVIRAFPQECFDFHFAEPAQQEDLRQARAIIAFTRQ